MPVVVLDVGGEHTLEVAASADEDPVEAFSADRTDEAFGVAVGLRRPDRGPDLPEPFTAYDFVELGRELRVAVTDQELPAREAPAGAHREVAGLLGDPRAGGMRGDAGEVDAAGVE